LIVFGSTLVDKHFKVFETIIHSSQVVVITQPHSRIEKVLEVGLELDKRRLNE